MALTEQPNRHSVALFTDLYELTMAYGYWKLGRSDEEAVFQQFFRENPFRGGYAVAAGLADVVDFLGRLHFDPTSLEYLASLTGNDGRRLFEESFLDYLGGLKFRCDMDAVPEGTVVFAGEPLVRVKGPILQCQIVESALLNLINFQTLIATKAARVCDAARDQQVVEFGLRRAQGVNGSLAASRAAYLGGCAATSNVLAGQLFNIPVKGTHAHSWVMSFASEPEAFQRYAEVMPNNCVFLVDTYDTLDGVRNAIEAGRRLREGGHEMVGIRLDSGDLAYLSIEARRMLKEAGFPGATIVASNDLDEHLIRSLNDQGAEIDVWGVGTKLATAFDQPALGGVYKLTALKNHDGRWEHKIKLSEQTAKITTPGILQVRRFHVDNGFVADMIYDEIIGPSDLSQIVDPADGTRRRKIEAGAESEDLLVPVFRDGRLVYEQPSLNDSRDRARQQLARFHPAIRRLLNPHVYPVGLEKGLFDLRSELIRQARGIENHVV